MLLTKSWHQRLSVRWSDLITNFGHKVVHGRTKLILTGYRLNVMTHGLEKRSPALPLGIEVQSAYCTLSSGSGRVTVVVRNSTRDWIEVAKGIPLARMESANQVPPITGFISEAGSDEKKNPVGRRKTGTASGKAGSVWTGRMDL